MKKSYTNDTVAQKEALVNEFKGNLFEFLLSKKISIHFGLYKQFMASFVKDLKKQKYFQQYETWLKEYAPHVLAQLPILAEDTFSVLLSYLEKNEIKEVFEVKLVGKSFDEHKDFFYEADIVLYHGTTYLPISLKLCKKGSFVNTKSAGVSSFLGKYFKAFPHSGFHQEELNYLLDESFVEMGEKLYEQIGLTFKGQFGKEWVERGMSELPGQLDHEMKKIVHDSYGPPIKKIYESFLSFQKEDSLLLKECLFSILGLTHKNLIQVFCYHSGTGDYQFDHCHIQNSADVYNELDKVEILPLVSKRASFELKMSHSKLQIRIKPMNKFTTKAHKINCSYLKFI